MARLAEYLRTLESFDLIQRDQGDLHLEYVFKHLFTQESV